MAYPTKMRERALEAYRKGNAKGAVNEMYGLGVNTLRSWEKLEAETGSLEKRELNRGAYKINRERLLEYYKNNPLSTNKEAAVAFNCSVSGIRSAKKVMKITRKKDDPVHRTG
jgi:transposase